MNCKELIIKGIADCKHCFFYNEGQEDCNFTTCIFLDENEYYP